MTKSEAVDTLQKCNWFEQACKNIGKSEWEDLRQDFWIGFLNRPDDFFERINNLQFYVVRCLINLNTNNLTRNKENGHRSIDMVDIVYHEPERPGIDPYILKDHILGKLPFYERVLFKLHEKGMSCREIARQTKIDRLEVNRAINSVKDILRDVKIYTSTY